MGFLDQVIGAIGNPNQMGNILNTVAQITNNSGVDSSTNNLVLSLVGNSVRSALQEKQENDGTEQTQELVNQYSGNESNPEAVNAIFSPERLDWLVTEIAEKTGLDTGIIHQMLPILVPVVLNLLGSGAHPETGANPLLNAFLDNDHDGDVDITDIMGMAGRYLTR